MKRHLVIAAVALLACMSSGTPTRATGNLEVRNTDGRIVNLVWPGSWFPIVWRYNDPATVATCGYSSATAPVGTLLPEVTAAFSTWQDDLDSRLTFQYGGTTATKDVACDGNRIVTFCSNTAWGTGIIAAVAKYEFTSQVTIDPGGSCPAGQGPLECGPNVWCVPSGVYPAGTLIDADLDVNTSTPANNEESFSTMDPNDPAVVNKSDVQALALHELGHFVGLSHEPISHAVMCQGCNILPFSSPGGRRVLQRSDRSIVGHYYPEASYATDYGSITGSVTLDGLPADGVHVVAIDPDTMLGAVGRLSISRQEDSRSLGSEGPDFVSHGPGFYRIDGLPPGRYYVYVEYFDASDRWSTRLSNGTRFNPTIANSNVSNGNGSAAGQSPDWLGFLPALAEFYDAAESGDGGDGVTPGIAADNADAATLVQVAAGQITEGVDIAINIEPVNGQTPADRQNPTARTVVRNDDEQSGDYRTCLYLDSVGNDNFYAVRYPAASLPPPPYNIAEGKWYRYGKNDLPIPARLTYGDPDDPSKPALNDPIVASAGRVLSGGPNGMTEGATRVDVRDQWNVTINESRDIWIVLNQPPRPPGTTYCVEGYYVYTTRTAAHQARVNRTRSTLNGGSTWSNVAADVFYDLILETAPPVRILGATPSAGEQGTTLDVAVGGIGFRDGATVSFGPDITVNAVTFVSAAELQASISIPCSGWSPNRAIDVTVTNPEVLFPNVSRVFSVTPSLTDTDCDGAPNTQDCAPGDPTAFAVPFEVTGLMFESDGTTLAFNSAAPGAGSGTVHDAARGDLAELPVGSGPSEACVGWGVPGASVSDPGVPASGSGFWYLVRGRNACGAGTYGTASAGTPRTTSTCP